MSGPYAGLMPVLLTSRSRLPNVSMRGDGVVLVLDVVGLAGDGDRVLGSAELLDRRVERLLACGR